MAGYFKIGYGECNFDTYSFGTAQGVIVPQQGPSWHGYESLGGVDHLQAQRGVVGSESHRRCRRGHRLGSAPPMVGRDALARLGEPGRRHPRCAGDQLSGRPAVSTCLASVPTTGSTTDSSREDGAIGRAAVANCRPSRAQCRGDRIESMCSTVWTLRCGICGGTATIGAAGRTSVASSTPVQRSHHGAPDRLDCFVKGTDSHLYHKWWDGNAWSGWENLQGYVAAEPGAVSWAPNRIDVFYPGVSFHMMHKWWDGAHWSGEEDLGGVLCSGVGVSSWAASRLDCFGRGHGFGALP